MSEQEPKPEYTLTEFEHDYHLMQIALREAYLISDMIEAKIKIRHATFPSWNDKFCVWLTYATKVKQAFHAMARGK